MGGGGLIAKVTVLGSVQEIQGDSTLRGGDLPWEFGDLTTSSAETRLLEMSGHILSLLEECH